MNSLSQLLRQATRLTRAGQLREATAAIQRALGSKRAAPSAAQSAPAHAGTAAGTDTDTDVIDIEARIVDVAQAPKAAAAPAAPPATAPNSEEAARAERRPAAAPDLRAWQAREAAPQSDVPAPDSAAPARAAAPSAPGRFLSGSYADAAGTRPYKLFVPAAATVQPRPLLVLLHGCKQNPDDFAAGTRMNELAQAHGWVVLYPAQPNSANGSGCWNWFQAADQQRGRGEPAILAGMTRHIIATEGIDPQRVYVAGLSAGGAMAATLAGTYPDLFAAVGIHSGLPHGVAQDLMSALTAMRQGPAAAGRVAALPAIVFHGDRDKTVHPGNGEALIAPTAGAAPAFVPAPPPRVETGKAPGGRRYTRSSYLDAAGAVRAEHWLVHGAGHAWSGGSTAGSYTDPTGPDASAEMLRFFAGYRVPGGSSAT